VTLLAARCRILLTGVAAVAATVLLAAPATASTTPAGAGCPHRPVVHPFTPWSDSADYFLAPNGGFEQGATSWALRGSAAVAVGNEPFHVAGPRDTRSLRLLAGSSATTAPFCIGVEHRTMRFVTNAAASSSLNVDAVIDGAGGTQRAVRMGTVRGSGTWAPSAIVPMVVNTLAAQTGNAMNVRLRFTPYGSGSWSIDDVFVDPYHRG
jgi:hypothetical protein